MKRIQSVALSFALAMLPLTLARAGSKPGNQTAQAKAIFEQIDANSSEIADVAQQLEERAKSASDSEQELVGLDTLRKDVNSIGSELTALDAERASLSPWEVEALDRTTTLMLDVAANTEKAIETFNAERTHLWASAFPTETAKASSEADEVKSLVSGYLKLAKAREQEERLEHSLKVVPQD
jgi:uncharacterized phage infection (PIP) family protein YhgE